MKYLKRFLESEKSANTWGGVPTKPTEPPDRPSNSHANLGGGAYKTYETPEPGSSPDHPMLDIAADWRWEVANWPQERWTQWRRRVGILIRPEADLDEIQANEHGAFLEIVAQISTEKAAADFAANPFPTKAASPFAGTAIGPFRVTATGRS